MKLKLFTLILIFSTFLGFSQNIILSENSEISILNCGTGNESYSLYGHTAIRIKDIPNNLDIVFNYGTFDFETPNFMLKFIKGDLQYFVSTNTFSNFYYNYQLEQRSVYEQKIKLSQTEKQSLFDSLNQSLYSDERFYTYKFIDRNCTTMVIDKVNEQIEDHKIESIKPIEKTYREILYPYMDNFFFQKLGINLIFGTKVDQPAERLFLPLELIQSLERNPIAKEKETLYEAVKIYYQPHFLDNIYTLIAILALIVLSRKKWLWIAYFLLLGFLGLFFCIVGLYSFHEEVLWNYNALLTNPLYLILAYYFYKNEKQKISVLAKIIFISHLLYLVYMLNKIHLGIISPILVANFILLALLIKVNKRIIN